MERKTIRHDLASLMNQWKQQKVFVRNSCDTLTHPDENMSILLIAQLRYGLKVIELANSGVRSWKGRRARVRGRLRLQRVQGFSYSRWSIV